MEKGKGTVTEPAIPSPGIWYMPSESYGEATILIFKTNGKYRWLVDGADLTHQNLFSSDWERVLECYGDKYFSHEARMQLPLEFILPSVD